MDDTPRNPIDFKTAVPPFQRIRVTFAKGEALRWTGHLDLQRVWERLLRRTRLPVAYSQGFRPSVRIQLACALPLGFTSRCELADLWLEFAPPLAEIEAALRRCAPPGLEIMEVAPVPLDEPSLQTRVRSAEYCITLLDLPGAADAAALFAPLLIATSLPRVWRKKSYDLRPLIEDLRVLEPDQDGRARILLRLAARPGATGRPEEVLTAAGLDPHAARVERTALLLES